MVLCHAFIRIGLGNTSSNAKCRLFWHWQFMNRGGIFMYPADARNVKNVGRIRLMYEANPMSMLVEQAGGAATNGLIPLMDVKPERLHMRVPVFLGSKEEVERVTRYHHEGK